MFSLDIAEGITSFGQVAIKFIADKMNEFLNSECQTEKDRVVYGDTDSVDGKSRISVNGKDITIEDYYASIPGREQVTPSGGYIKYPRNDETEACNERENVQVTKKITYAFRHEVEKEMFRIQVGDTFVDVTEDHSIIVQTQNGEIINKKPKDISTTDRLILRD